MIHYKKLRLKILEGINKGAVARFSSERLLIGSSPECDIVLSGFTTSEPRIEISYIDDCLCLKVLNKPINLDGVIIQPSEKEIPLKLYQFISFDTCCLAIGEHGKDWPSCADRKNQIESSRPQKTKVPSYLAMPAFQNYSLPKKLAVVFSLFALVFTGFLYNLSIQSPESERVTQVVSKEAKLKNQLKQGETQSLEVEKLAYGLLQTYGVNRINLNFQNNDGVLIATGYVGDNSKWEKAKTSILEDIDQVKKIESSGIETFTERLMTLNKVLAQRDMKKNLKINTDEKQDLITVSGELTHNAVKEWLDIKSSFGRSYKGTPKIDSNVIDIEQKIKLLIRGVDIGKTKYFTSVQGKKFMIGSDLGNGFRVSNIEVDKITLNYKGDIIPIYYSGYEDKQEKIVLNY